MPIKKEFFCQESCFNFFSIQDSIFFKHFKFEKVKELTKNLREELMLEV